MSYHIPVMLEECLNGLNISPEGKYVDATFGGGGHSHAILNKLDKNGKLYVFDQDINARQNLTHDDRVTFIHSNYRHLKKFLRLYKAIPVNGILADFGVSSYQIDTPERGFSIRHDGKLDMRMNPDSTLSAWDVIHSYSENQLADIFFNYGEIKGSRKLAAHIKQSLKDGAAIETTGQLADTVRPFSKGGKDSKFLAQVFQAIRIEVNDEIKAIEEFLVQTTEVLAPKGRLVTLSYHSLEDRPVKNYIKFGVISGQPQKDIYGNFDCPWSAITKKPITANDEELKRNPRSRSAKLRIAERK